MKRLTDRTAYGLAYVKSETGVEGVGASTTQRRLPELIVRLAAYEDTGLEPEEVAALQASFEELKEEAVPLIQAKIEGKLVVLPEQTSTTAAKGTAPQDSRSKKY